MKGKREEMNRIFLLSVAIGSLFSTSAVIAGDWNLRRNVGNGACSVQPSDSMPQLGAFLATHPTRKETCEDAKARKTDDAADTNKCFAYTNGTINECKSDGVDLPQ
jgi:hypothetical protein